jgi:hypothetical protein
MGQARSASSVQTAIKDANRAMGESALALQEFHLAAQQGEWERAEAARDRVCAHNEVALDAFMVAYRLSWLEEG